MKVKNDGSVYGSNQARRPAESKENKIVLFLKSDYRPNSFTIIIHCMNGMTYSILPACNRHNMP